MDSEDKDKQLLDEAAAFAGLTDDVTIPVTSAPIPSTSSSLPDPILKTVTTTAPSFRHSLGQGVQFSTNKTLFGTPVTSPYNRRSSLYTGDHFSRYRDVEVLSEESSLIDHAPPPMPSSSRTGLPQVGGPTDISQLEEKIRLLDLQLKDSLRLYELATHADASDAHVLRENIALRTQLLESQRKNLTTMQEISMQNRTKFRLPKDDPTKTTPLKALLELIPKSSDIFTLLTRISSMAMAQNLSHRDIRILLINSLQGEALQVFCSMANFSVPEIFAALEKRFLSPENLSSYNTKLAHFKRKSDETIVQALERAKYLVRKSSSAYLPEDRAGREKSLIHNILLRIVAPGTARYLANSEEKALIEGRVLTIEELVLCAEQLECLSTKDTSTVDFSVENIETKGESDDPEVNVASHGILRPPVLQAPESKTLPQKPSLPQRMSRSRSRDPRDERRLERQSRSRERRQDFVRNRRSSSMTGNDVHMTSPTRDDKRRQFSRPTSVPRYYDDRPRTNMGYDYRPRFSGFSRNLPEPTPPRTRYVAPPETMTYPVSHYWEPPMNNNRSRFYGNSQGRMSRNWQGPMRHMQYMDRQAGGPPFLETTGPLVQRFFFPPYIQQWHRNDRRPQGGFQQYRANNNNRFNRERFEPRRNQDYRRQEHPRSRGNYQGASAARNSLRHLRR